MFPNCVEIGIGSTIPVPKVPKPQTANDLRPIALALIFGRVFESVLVRWLRKEFEPEQDPLQ